MTNDGTLKALGVGQSGILLVGVSGDAGTVVNAGTISATEGQSTPSHDAGIRLDNYGKVTNAKTGKITVSGSYIAGIGIYDGGTVTNSGTVSVSGSNVSGVFFNLGGKLTNSAGRSITCQDDGVFAWNDPVQITNAGSITGPSGDGVQLTAGGTVSNQKGGTITGNNVGIYISGAAGTVTNSGSVTGQNGFGVWLRAGGSVDNKAGATITGSGTYFATVSLDGYGVVTNAGGIYATGNNLSGVALHQGGGKVINSGTVKVSGQDMSGVNLHYGGAVTNTGTIYGSGSNLAGVALAAGGTVTNSGSIDAKGTITSGIDLDEGGTVTNLARGTISGESGVRESGLYEAGGAAATVTNAGSITGTTATTVNSTEIFGDGVGLWAGGTVTNDAGGSITGARYGVYITGGAGSVTNAGTISGANGSVEFAGTGANTLTLESGSVLTGTAYGSTASGATNALVLEGTGTADNSFDNFDTLTVKASGDWTLGGDSTIGAATISSSGTLIVTGDLDVTGNFANAHDVLVSSGTLDLQGAVTGKGTDEVSAASTLEFGSTVTGNVVDFTGGPSAVDLIDPTGFSGKFENFASTDTLDLAGDWNYLHFSENSGATLGTLTLENVATNTDLSLKFVGDYSASDFAITPGMTSTTIAHT